MAVPRQQAFQQLRGPCVELSSVVLKFRAHQSSVKNVSQALETALAALQQLGDADALDEKLAEYAFFPFTHIFNEAQRLSSTCLELAVRSLNILISRGWRQHLAPEMGKQLLILITLIAGGHPEKQLEAPSEELKVASFRCIDAVIKQLTGRVDARRMFDDVGAKSIVDPLAYLLLESVSKATSDQVQLAAAEALMTLVSTMSSRVLLASLLPRTASSLAQSLRTSTKARRTGKVLVAYLKLLLFILRAVLADDTVYRAATSDQPPRSTAPAAPEPLDDAWLLATTSQVNLVIIQVVKLRNHDSADVRQAVAELCFMIVEDCAKSLSESIAVAVDTIAFIAQRQEGASLIPRLETLSASNSDIMSTVMAKLHDLAHSLPRAMQGNDDRTKQALIGQIRVFLLVAAYSSCVSDDVLRTLTIKILEGIATSETLTSPTSGPLRANQDLVSEDLRLGTVSRVNKFAPLVLNHSSQYSSLQQMEHLIHSLRQGGFSNQIAQLIIDRIPGMTPLEQISGTWLAMICLKDENPEDSMLITPNAQDGNRDISRSRLISELYAAILPLLTEQDVPDVDREWRLSAVAIECAVMQAKQLDFSYRPELLDTLYPILSLLGSSNSQLRLHAATGLNLLAEACAYPSTSDMLIDNVDYLINAVGMKLNSFDISPQAPQVLLMMLRLCGARIVPYIDDLVGSIFTALDNFHGYPSLVELLFQVLKGVIEESRKQPGLAITNGLSTPDHQKITDQLSQVNDILNDLRTRESRRQKARAAEEEVDHAPHRAWEWVKPDTETNKEDQEPNADTQRVSATQEEARKLSKPHQLLLSIAKATSPHLTSPSPRVRSVLLQLLDEISPLLAQDENSFLPLINTVWPSIVPRLLDSSDGSTDSETSYNICAAADAIATLCKGAGNFMSSRVEDIFPKLQKLFERMQGRTQPSSNAKPIVGDDQALLPLTSGASSVTNRRSPRSMIFAALIRLLTAILAHVRVSADIGDEILAMLAPSSDCSLGGEIESVLRTYNADAFWVWAQLSGSYIGQSGSRQDK